MEDTVANRKPNHFHNNYKDERAPYENGIKSLTGIARSLKYGLFLFIPLAFIQASITAYALWDIAAYQLFIARAYMEGESWIHALTAFSIAYRLTYIGCIFLSSWLLYRATRNLHTAIPAQLKITPHWAWLWFWIPFANFYKPYQAVAEIDRTTRATIGASKTENPLLMIWWVIFILSVFIGATNFTLPIANMYAVSLSFDVISGLLGIIAAILFVGITQKLAEHQEHLKLSGVAHVFD